MGELKMLVAANLKAICKSKGIRQVDLAAHLGVSQGSVANMLNGVSGIDIDVLISICELLGITLNQVYGLDPVDGVLSCDELNLVNIYRALDHVGRQKVVDYADDLAATHRYDAEDEQLRELMKKAAPSDGSSELTELPG